MFGAPGLDRLKAWKPLSEEIWEKLQAYLRLLDEFAAPRGLVGFGAERYNEQLVRSLLLTEALLGPGSVVDVGSGAGLPGIPLAIACELEITLLEPRRTAVAFLELALRELGLNAEVVQMRAEQALSHANFEPFDAAVARALAPPSVATGLCLPLVKAQGVVVLTAGPDDVSPISPDIASGAISSVTRRLDGPGDIHQLVHIVKKKGQGGIQADSPAVG